MPTPEDTSQAPDNPAFVSKPAPDGYRYAGAWIRLAALIIDSLILLPVGFALGMGIGLFLAIAYPSVNLDMDGWPDILEKWVGPRADRLDVRLKDGCREAQYLSESGANRQHRRLSRKRHAAVGVW